MDYLSGDVEFDPYDTRLQYNLDITIPDITISSVITIAPATVPCYNDIVISRFYRTVTKAPMRA